MKNTLARRACAEAGTDALLEYLVGQTALVWAEGDAAPVAKVLNDFGTATDNRLSMKGGILDGAPISGAEVKRLAALPPRDELLARLVGGVASPLQGTVNALSSLLSGMARALGAYQAQRAVEAPAEAVAPEPTEATAAEETPVADDAPSSEETPVAVAEATAEESTEDTPAAEETPAAVAEESTEDTPAAEATAEESTEDTPAAEATPAAVAEESTENTPAAEETPTTDDSTDAEQQSAADDTADAEPAADQTTEGD